MVFDRKTEADHADCKSRKHTDLAAIKEHYSRVQKRYVTVSSEFLLLLLRCCSVLWRQVAWGGFSALLRFSKWACVRCPDGTTKVPAESFHLAGALSFLWRECVNWFVDFGIHPDAIVAVPYDWYLSGAWRSETSIFRNWSKCCALYCFLDQEDCWSGGHCIAVKLVGTSVSKTNTCFEQQSQSGPQPLFLIFFW